MPTPGARVEPDEREDTNVICERCNGAGKIGYEEDHLNAEGDVVGHTWGTRQCSCVRDLPSIDGAATWWDSEVVWQRVWNDSIYPDAVVEMTVSAEVPLNEDGRRVHLRGNRYYPTMVDVDLPDHLLMHPFQVRELARRLMEAASVCEGFDEPCEDSCGHWAPCDCASPALPAKSKEME